MLVIYSTVVPQRNALTGWSVAKRFDSCNIVFQSELSYRQVGTFLEI